VNSVIVVLVGAGVGLLFALMILFEPNEPYRGFIIVASTLRNALGTLLTAYVIAPAPTGWGGAGWGAMFGLLLGTVVYLAKGGWRSGAAPLLLPSAAVTGAISGALVAWLAF